jgi:hypothetical protein
MPTPAAVLLALAKLHLERRPEAPAAAPSHRRRILAALLFAGNLQPRLAEAVDEMLDQFRVPKLSVLRQNQSFFAEMLAG